MQRSQDAPLRAADAEPGEIRLHRVPQEAADAEDPAEGGLGGFVIRRDGKEITRLPEKPVGRFGRPLFQTMSYHDTPEKPLPAMTFTDTTVSTGEKYRYEVLSVNGVGLRSKPAAVTVRAPRIIRSQVHER